MIVALLLLGASFAGANLWYTAVRSTIPLKLSGKVTGKQRLIEKTPGVDDVYIVTLDSNRRIQVDGAVFDALTENLSINKRAWTRVLDVDGRRIALSWSSDFRGMLWAMPLVVTAFIALGVVSIERPLRSADERDAE